MAPVTQPASPVVRPPASGDTYNVAGIPSRCVLVSADTGGAFSLFDVIAPPGEGVPAHMHSREDETFIILEGALTMTVAEQSVVATPGTVVHAPRGVPHQYRNETDAPARFYVLTAPGGFENFFAEVERALPPGQPVDVVTFTRVIEAHGMTVVGETA